MEYGFSILMFCFAGTLLLYAGLVAMGNAGLIWRFHARPRTSPCATRRRTRRQEEMREEID